LLLLAQSEGLDLESADSIGWGGCGQLMVAWKYPAKPWGRHRFQMAILLPVKQQA